MGKKITDKTRIDFLTKYGATLEPTCDGEFAVMWEPTMNTQYGKTPRQAIDLAMWAASEVNKKIAAMKAESEGER